MPSCNKRHSLVSETAIAMLNTTGNGLNEKKALLSTIAYSTYYIPYLTEKVKKIAVVEKILKKLKKLANLVDKCNTSMLQ